MQSRAYLVEAAALEQRCLSCGIPVDSHPSSIEACHHCGCDFLDRPPRSYAEMEGIEEVVEVTSPNLQAWTVWREQMLVERWLWFLFGLGLMAIMAMLAFLS